MVGYWLLHFAEVHSSSGTGTKLTVHCTMVWTSSKKLPKMDTAPHLRGGRFCPVRRSVNHAASAARADAVAAAALWRLWRQEEEEGQVAFEAQR